VKEIKTIVHPGEVNKIRELPQHPEIIVTHTDAPELYVWNVDRQPDQKKGTVSDEEGGAERGGGGR
jgi:histone-binding protein RBBP4